MRKEWKYKQWRKKAAAVSLALAMTCSLMPQDTLLAHTAEAVTVEDCSQVDASSYELQGDIQGANILHCWNWSYKTIEEHMELIAQCGYTALQTSPAQQPKDYAYQGTIGMEMGYPALHGKGNWWKMYQPVTFDVCDNGLTWLGTKEELESMCAKAEEYGVKVIVDIVANHMGNINGWQNSLSDVSPQVGEFWNPDMLVNEEYWHINEGQYVHSSDSRYHFTQGCMGMPDLNTANKKVQKYVYEYLDELIDCGVDGFRFDAAKHIETPEDDPKFSSDFWPTVLDEARGHYKSKTGGNLYVYGEILNTVGDDFDIVNYTKRMSVTDNSAGHHLLETVRNGQAASPGLHYPADKSVIWAESHDTYMNESSNYASDKSIVRAWAAVANVNNAASLFYVRPYESKYTLKNDQDGSRQDNDVMANAVAPAIMGDCETYVWATKEVAAINHFNNRMAGQPDQQGSNGSVMYVKRGNGAILVNFGGAGAVSVSCGLADGTYTDEVSGGKFTVSGGTVSGNITSEYGVAVLYNNTMSNPSNVYPVNIRSSIQDGSKIYLDTLGLTLTAKYADSATYTTSTGEAGSFKDSTRVEIGKGAKVGDKVTVTVEAKNASGTYQKTFTYEKADVDLDSCIFLKNKKGWTKAYAYVYNEDASKEVTAAYSGWPGVAMFEYEEAADGTMIYAVQIDDMEKYNKVNFNNNIAEQVASIGAYGQLYDNATGAWSDYYTPGAGKAKISTSMDSCEIHGVCQVELAVSNADQAYYYINDGEKVSFTDRTEVTIGEGLAEGESQTVTVEATKGDKVTTKIYTYTMGVNKPELSISPSDGTTFVDTLDVKLSASNVVEATYQIGNEKAESISGTKTVTIGKDMADGDTVLITLQGQSSNGNRDIKQVIYTKEVEDTGATSTNAIYFKNTANWSVVNAYAWVEKGVENGAWPGPEMKLYDKENNIYMIELDSPNYKNIIFSQNKASQTKDIKIEGYGMLYDYSTGAWSKYAEPVLGVRASRTSCIIEAAEEITFTATAATKATVSVDGGKEESFTDTTTLKVGEGKKAGEETIVTVTVTNGTDTITRTYRYIVKSEGTVTEEKAITGIKVGNYEGEYDGKAHSIFVQIPEGATILYGTSKGNYTEAKAPEYKEIGKYVIYFKVSMDGYKDYEGSGMVIIKEKDGLEETPVNATKEPTMQPGQTTAPTKAPTVAPSTTPAGQELPAETENPSGDVEVTAVPSEAPVALSITKFSFSPVAEQVVKKKVTMNVEVTSAGDQLLYNVTVRNSKGTAVYDSSEESCLKKCSFTWTPKVAGTYKATLTVTDSNGNIETCVKSYVVVKKKLAVSKITNKKTVKKGKKLTFKVKAVGGKTKYQYKFAIYNAAQKKVKSTSYRSSATWTWKATKKGTYSLKVTVKDAAGKTVTRTVKKIKVV